MLASFMLYIQGEIIAFLMKTWVIFEYNLFLDFVYD